MLFRLLLVLLPLGFVSCKKTEQAAPERAFYYWKQRFALNHSERQSLQAFGINRLYVKLFDLKWQQGEALPVAEIHWQDSIPPGIETVPVVYIVNEVFLQADSAACDSLAQRVYRHVRRLMPVNFSEIQIDCDWTQRSRGHYFYFLQRLRERAAPAVLSVTLRLHQLAWPRSAGLPPADRAVLMYYNMTPVQQLSTRNSILDNEAGQQYLQRSNAYPLPLDIALPVFRWGVVFRMEKIAGLLNGADERNIEPYSKFIKKNWYRFTRDTVLNGEFYRFGDALRLESVHPSALRQAARNCTGFAGPGPHHVILFHLDSALIESYAQQTLLYAFRLAK